MTFSLLSAERWRCLGEVAVFCMESNIGALCVLRTVPNNSKSYGETGHPWTEYTNYKHGGTGNCWVYRSGERESERGKEGRKEGRGGGIVSKTNSKNVENVQYKENGESQL